MNFQPYPFEKLQNLISQITPKNEVIKLSIGEPQFPTPQIIQKTLNEYSHELRFYPKSRGEPYLYDAILDFINHRFSLKLTTSQIIPTLGTREVLFNLPQFLLSSKISPTIAYPNPFYQIYEGAQIASRARVIYMPLISENNFKPSLSPEEMREVDLVILNSPNNPTGSTLSQQELEKWVENALSYNFILINDECYSEIYEDNPPSGILQASVAVGNKNFKNILTLNSISKRLSAPGLRSGFIAGDEEILKSYLTYRSYLGTAIPNPIQRSSAIAWKAHSEAEAIRKKYAQNLKIAREIFTDTKIFPYSFYVWLYVGDDEEFCKKLYERHSILVLPGSYLGRNQAGKGYVRIALVYEPSVLRQALEAINHFKKEFLEKFY